MSNSGLPKQYVPRKTKILMIAPTPFFADRGCHTRIYGQVTSLEKLGYEVILCTYGLGRDVPGVKCVRCRNFPWYNKLSAGPSITKIFLLPLLLFTCLKQIKAFKPDIIHAFLHEGAFIARICNIFYSKPHYFHDLQGSLSMELADHGFGRKGGILNRFWVALEKRINSWFPIITLSENLVEQAVATGVSRDDIINVLDGVDVDIFKPMATDIKLADALSIDLTRPRVLFMGLLEEYQGVDLMLQAFSTVHLKHPDTQFILIGYPNIDKYKEQCKRLGIYNNTIFTGRVPFQDVPGYLSLSTIAISPKISPTEGSGKIYNYMAMGMATVSTDRNVSREIFGDDPGNICGLLSKFKDPDDMAEKIISLIENGALCGEIGNNARKRAVEYLSYDTGAEKIKSFYQKYM